MLPYISVYYSKFQYVTVYLGMSGYSSTFYGIFQ